MWQRLTCEQETEAARRFVSALLDERGEWFCTERATDARRELSALEVNRVTSALAEVNAPASALSKVNTGTSALRAGEWELRAAHGSLFLSLLTARGARLWRINAWEWTGERLLLSVTRRAGAETSTLELIPRASASAARATLEAARRARCERMAALLCATYTHAKLERATLSRGARRGEQGRYARIIVGTRRERIAATGPVAPVAPHETDAFLASTLLWFARLANGSTRERRPLRLRLVVPHDISEATAERVALLRQDLRRVISIDEADDDLETLAPVGVPDLEALLAEAAPRLARPPETPLSDAAREIIAHAPAAIDAVRARQGETLRFHGLAFARVRRWLGREQVWFGVEAATRNRPHADTPAAQRRINGSTAPSAVASRRQLLDASNRAQFLKLLHELQTHRRPAPDNPRHAFYTAAPEAWLESLLRRDITRLDPSLRLSPLHAQFRTSSSDASAAARPIDLLALRRDGRLVVVELKVSEDAALPLQGADYWRRVEAARRRGLISASRLFGDTEISDQPPLVYLVAPLLSFHRSLPTLARTITPRIEIYRLDLNEDWRASIRTSRVQTLTKQGG